LSDGYAKFNIPVWNSRLFPDAIGLVQYPVTDTNLIVSFFFWRNLGQEDTATITIRTENWKEKLILIYHGIRLGRSYAALRDFGLVIWRNIFPKSVVGMRHESQEYEFSTRVEIINEDRHSVEKSE
jgi:hypothetical protein